MSRQSWLDRATRQRANTGLRLWVEALLVGGVYFAYSLVRNLFGSAAVGPDIAVRNADWIIDIEKAMGLYLEAEVQEIFIGANWFIQFWNLFYGAFHFLITFGALIWLYVKFPDDYRFWRRTGLIATGTALIGFAAFPLMPPRLLGDCGAYGACRPGETFVDTVIEVGGIWSFESSGWETISNQYAAMPSLHIGWALWCAWVLVPRLQSRIAKALAASYPALTMFAIVVTANHYWIDGLGGVVVVAVGYWASRIYAHVTEATAPKRIRNAHDSGSDDFGSNVGAGAT